MGRPDNQRALASKLSGLLQAVHTKDGCSHGVQAFPTVREAIDDGSSTWEGRLRTMQTVPEYWGRAGWCLPHVTIPANEPSHAGDQSVRSAASRAPPHQPRLFCLSCDQPLDALSIARIWSVLFPMSRPPIDFRLCSVTRKHSLGPCYDTPDTPAHEGHSPTPQRCFTTSASVDKILRCFILNILP